MKTHFNIPRQLPSLAVGALLSFSNPASAAVVEKVEPTTDAPATKNEITATGTVFSVEPEVLSVVMKDNPTPVRFTYSKTTPFLDEKGEAVPLDLVRADLPLTVYYEMEGEQMVARRVIMSRSMVAGDANEKPDRKRLELAEEKAVAASRAVEAEPLLPREITGTVSTIEQTISLVGRGETTPITCIINNSTRYVNVSGQPVSTQWLMPGMPISVKTVRDGKRVIAQEIIVRGNPATLTGRTNATQDGGNTSQNRRSSTESPGTASGYIDPVPGSGYVIPSQIIPPSGVPVAPGTPGSPNNNPPAAGNPNSPNNPGNPTQPTNPNSPRQPGAAPQPNSPAQPDDKQPNVPPAGGANPSSGGTPSPARPGGSTPGSSGNASGPPRTGTSSSGNR